MGSSGQDPSRPCRWGRTESAGVGAGQGPQKEGQEQGRAAKQGCTLWAGLEAYNPSSHSWFWQVTHRQLQSQMGDRPLSCLHFLETFPGSPGYIVFASHS